MMRFYRVRSHDPICKLDKYASHFGKLGTPLLTKAYDDNEILTPEILQSLESTSPDLRMQFSVEQIRHMLPSYDERRAMLAQDPLASVEGFRFSILLVCEYLFGLRVCSDCPRCNASRKSCFRCSDLFGSNAYAEGGVFGRADGALISIEAQKSSGGLHAHAQVHMQCLHQHTPLLDIFEKIENGDTQLVKEMLAYKAHVSKQQYDDLPGWITRQARIEEAWPEYKRDVCLLSKPSYLGANLGGQEWLTHYSQHVQTVQERKQNHVHTFNSKGERIPLAHCQRSDDRKKCKADFPRTLWKISDAVVLCEGLLRKMGMPSSGRRNKLGSMHGPQNEDNINGSHPALLAALQCNSDVQLPYRLPVCGSTHATQHCDASCTKHVDYKEMLESVQNTQDAQAGYACDYTTKRAARSVNESKEAMKGLRKLGKTLYDSESSIATIGRRLCLRLLNDTYGKGIVRSNQESMNLRLHYNETYVLKAESFSTSPTVIFPGRDLCSWREAIFENREHVQVLARVDIDRRNPSRNTPVTKNVAYAYGHRPRNSPLWFLSAYEFMRSWTLELATYPKDADAEDDNEAIHAHLTASGREKFKAAKGAKEKADMKPEKITL